jgi:hypothetical protein
MSGSYLENLHEIDNLQQLLISNTLLGVDVAHYN